MFRMYLSHFTPEMEQAIRLAEEESSRICELCGVPGDLFISRSGDDPLFTPSSRTG